MESNEHILSIICICSFHRFFVHTPLKSVMSILFCMNIFLALTYCVCVIYAPGLTGS